jgi:hypothetical protein
MYFAHADARVGRYGVLKNQRDVVIKRENAFCPFKWEMSNDYS